MYLKDDKITIKIDGVTMVSHTSVYSTKVSRFILDPDAIQGWHDGVDVRGAKTNRPTSWGDFKEKTLLSSRLISISGTAIAPTYTELHKLRDKFSGILVEGDLKEMSLSDSDGTRYSTVQLGGKPSWTQLSDTVASWKLELYAPDPRIYGVKKTVSIENQSSFGGLTYALSYPLDYGIVVNKQYVGIDNLGNTDAWPVFIVYGDYGGGFTIKDNLGHQISYNGTVSLSSPVTIDSMTGSAKQNNVDRSVYLTSREWFPVGPDKILQPSFIPKQDTPGWCDIIYRDTWI